MTDSPRITLIYETGVVLNAREQKHVINRVRHAMRFIAADLTVEFVLLPSKLRLVDPPDQAQA